MFHFSSNLVVNSLELVLKPYELFANLQMIATGNIGWFRVLATNQSRTPCFGNWYWLLLLLVHMYT